MAVPELTPGDAMPLIDAAGVHVVTSQHQWPVHLTHRCDRAQGNHGSAMIADLKAVDVVFLVAVLGHRLDDHLPGAAEPIEVVDVERAEIGLQAS